MENKIDSKQKRKYGVYYIGAPFGNEAMGELEISSDNYEKCVEYIGKHPRLYGSNSIIREKED